MTRLTPDQEEYLAQIVTHRARYGRALRKSDKLRAQLNAMISQGATLGISTHRLATAAQLSQPRVFQLINEDPMKEPLR